MVCNYRFCKQIISTYKNGNRRYCDQECYESEKRERSKENYQAIKQLLKVIKCTESIFRNLYKQYGSTPINPNILKAEEINWSLMTSFKEIDGQNVRFVGSYGYSKLENNYIKLYKL